MRLIVKSQNVYMLKEKKNDFNDMFRALRRKRLAFLFNDFTVEIVNYSTSFPQHPLNTFKGT